MKLTVIRGLPGSGKSTYAKKNYDCLILEQDMFFIVDGEYKWSAAGMGAAVRWCQSMTADALASGMDVCVVNTSLKKTYVDFYARLAQEHGASFEVIHMTGNYGNVHNVPKNVLDNMAKSEESYPGEKVI